MKIIIGVLLIVVLSLLIVTISVLNRVERLESLFTEQHTFIYSNVILIERSGGTNHRINDGIFMTNPATQ